MANENAVLNREENLNENSNLPLNLEELEEKLQSQLEDDLADMRFLQEEKEKIGNPDNLGDVVMNVVWEQFLNQVAVTAGEDFIKENRGLHLDLRKEAHFQRTKNFAKGKIATHNTEIDYQQRYDDWQSNFVKDENGNVVTHKTRSGKEEATLVEDARKPFDDERKKRGLVGNAEKGTDMDETVPVAEIIRDPSANAHMTEEERIEFDISEKNLNEIDSGWNRSKGDTPTNEWLDNTNSKGQKPQEIFDNMTDEDVEKLRQKDAEAREEFEKKKKEAEQKSIEAGKKSRKEEAFRIGGKALRAAVMTLLADLVKEIIAKLVKWFKSAKKVIGTLLDSLKEAIHSFIRNLKMKLIQAGDAVFSTVATAIIGPVFGTIKKVWMMLKQGFESLKNAVNYIKNPDNKGKPINILLMEAGEIIIAGLTGAGSLVLGEVIEKGLGSIPIFLIEIPMLGSLANILGIFFGAVVAGIIGAIALNIIDDLITKKQNSDLQKSKIGKANEVLVTQAKQKVVAEEILKNAKDDAQSNISNRHTESGKIIKNSLAHVMEDFVSIPQNDQNITIVDDKDIETNKKLDDIKAILNGLKSRS